MDLQAFSEILKVFLQVANIVVLGYALYKFLNKPHDTLEEKHEELKKRVDEQAGQPAASPDYPFPPQRRSHGLAGTLRLPAG